MVRRGKNRRLQFDLGPVRQAIERFRAHLLWNPFHTSGAGPLVKGGGWQCGAFPPRKCSAVNERKWTKIDAHNPRRGACQSGRDPVGAASAATRPRQAAVASSWLTAMKARPSVRNTKVPCGSGLRPRCDAALRRMPMPRLRRGPVAAEAAPTASLRDFGGAASTYGAGGPATAGTMIEGVSGPPCRSSQLGMPGCRSRWDLISSRTIAALGPGPDRPPSGAVVGSR